MKFQVPKPSKHIAWMIKAILAIAFGISLYFQFQHKNIRSLNATILHHFGPKSYAALVLLLLLMLVNWSIEAYKWKLLVSKMQKISFLDALKGVWCGVTIGTFTPNRVGEFGGRILFLRERNQIKGIIVTLIGSFGQITTTLITGLSSLILFVLFINPFQIPHQFLPPHEFLIWILPILFALLIACLLLLYFNISLVENLSNRIPYLKRVRSYLSIIGQFGYVDLAKLLGLSLLRFSVFTFQFYLLLKAFQVPVPLWSGLMVISLIFFIQTIIPSFTLTEIGVRGQVSVYLLSFLLSADYSLRIIDASVSLWLVNLILPAIIGAFILASHKRKKQESEA
ncbi:MAG: hypothetical protein RL138_752 [Bacteroidota bacterium]